MSKTAQKRRSARQEGYRHGVSGDHVTVSSRWKFAEDFRAGYREGLAKRRQKIWDKVLKSRDEGEE